MSITLLYLLNAGLNQTDAVQDTAALLTGVRAKVAKTEKYMIIAAVALAALGVVLAFTLGAAAIIPFVMSAALFYGIYNLERVKTNIDSIISNPSQYTKVDASTASVGVDADKLKAKLKEKTFLFGWAVNSAINNSQFAKA